MNTLIYLPTENEISLVAQVLSYTVAAGICTLVRYKQFPEDAIHTARFVKSMDIAFYLVPHNIQINLWEMLLQMNQ